MAVADLRRKWGRALTDILLVTLSLWLLLFSASIQSGVVNGFATAILDTPDSLRIGVSPSGFTDADIRGLRADPDVGFVAPAVDFLNRSLQVMNASPDLRATVTPTGPGDPYFPDAASGPGEFDVWIGEDLALSTGRVTGDDLTLSYFVRDGEPAELIQLNIRGVVATSAAIERAALVSPRLVAAINARARKAQGQVVFDGSRPDFGLDGTERFISLRLYAKDLASVGPLVRKVNAMGWNAEANDRLIAQRLALDKATGMIVNVVTLSVWGIFTVSFGVTATARLLRLRSALGALTMHGATIWKAAAIPLFQTLMIGTIGASAAIGCFVMSARFLSGRLSGALEELGVTGRLITLDPMLALKTAGILFLTGTTVTLAATWFTGIRPVFPRTGEGDG